MSKTLPDLPTGTPAAEDLILYRDVSTNTDRQGPLSSIIPGGINGLLFRVLSADTAGADSATAQPWFPSTGAVAVEASKTYQFEGRLRISRAAGTTSHTTGLSFAGSATLTSIAYEAIVNTGDVVTNGAANKTSMEVATDTTVKAASTSATEQIDILVKGTVRVNAAGTLIPTFKYSSAPGGAPSILKNSYFQLYPIGSNVVTTQGTWS